jgi:hypothetical protein
MIDDLGVSHAFGTIAISNLCRQQFEIVHFAVG